jgi:hypothetical protein
LIKVVPVAVVCEMLVVDWVEVAELGSEDNGRFTFWPGNVRIGRLNPSAVHAL